MFFTKPDYLQDFLRLSSGLAVFLAHGASNYIVHP